MGRAAREPVKICAARLFITSDEPVENNMIRTLMTTTALAVLLTGGALAQATTDTNVTTAAPAAGAMNWDYSVNQGDNLASEIIGMQVYSSAAADAEHIGDINNLVVGEDGQVEAVVLGVGGFLGIGEKDVAVSMDSLQWVTAEDNTERYVLEATREALEGAPDFEWNDDMATADNAGAMATDPAMDNSMAADQNVAVTNDPAMESAVETDTNVAVDNTMAPADDMTADDTATGTVGTDNAMAPAGGAMMDPLDRTGLQPYDETQLTAEELIGTNVYGVNDEHIGAIGDLALAEDGSIDAIIIDFGGFLGIGTKPVAIGFENLDFLADPENVRSLVLPITRDQMDAAPAFNEDTYAAERDTQRLVINSAEAQS